MWKARYHPKVPEDLRSLGAYEANRVLKVIEERIIKGEPDKAGKPLSGALSGCRRIRTGDTRIIYQVNQTEAEVYILAIGPRKDNIVYKIAHQRS